MPSESTAEEVSFEWPHHRISFTGAKVEATVEGSIIDSGNERVKRTASQSHQLQCDLCSSFRRFPFLLSELFSVSLSN